MDLEVIRSVAETTTAGTLLDIMRDVSERQTLLSLDERRDLKFRLHMLGFSNELTLALFHYILAMNAFAGWVKGVFPNV